MKKLLLRKVQAALLVDFYKVSHRLMQVPGTELVYAAWTPRTSRVESVHKVVVFAVQKFIKEYLMDYFQVHFFDRSKEEIIAEFRRTIKYTLYAMDDSVTPESIDASHIEALHDLGYLPIEIKALREGTLCPIRVPYMTIWNTDKRFDWLTNYIESLASCEMWQAPTSATIALEYRQILDWFAEKTVGDTSFVPFQGHDFSFRGMSSVDSAISSGMGHLLSFVGTDTVPAIEGAEIYYNADIEKELVGTSIPASEHSIQCAYGDDLAYFKRLITEVHPSGFVSIVSDGYDFWGVMTEVLPRLKDTILARDGRVVIRPDSGDPVLIVTGYKVYTQKMDQYVGEAVEYANNNGFEVVAVRGHSEGDYGYFKIKQTPLGPDIGEAISEEEAKGAVECLWDTFGGTLTPKGYKLLDSHIGLIYGDSITLQRAYDICSRLEAKGFASINVVFGIGSFTYQYNTRDTFGFALKTSYNERNGESVMIWKDPKTDNGTKKSAKGRVAVIRDPLTKELTLVDGFDHMKDVPNDELITVFRNGELLVDHTWSDIKTRLQNEVKGIHEPPPTIAVAV